MTRQGLFLVRGRPGTLYWFDPMACPDEAVVQPAGERSTLDGESLPVHGHRGALERVRTSRGTEGTPKSGASPVGATTGNSEDGVRRRAKSRRRSDATSLRSTGSTQRVRRRETAGRTMKGILLPRYSTKPKGEEAEPHMWTAKAEDLAKNPDGSEGLLRGMGNGTSRRRTTEQERPSCVVLEWTSGGDKAKPKLRARRGSPRGS